MVDMMVEKLRKERMSEDVVADRIRDNWEKIKHLVKDYYEMTGSTYDTWIAPLSFIAYSNETAVIRIPGGVSKEGYSCIRRKYEAHLSKAIAFFSDLDGVRIVFIQEGGEL